MTNPTKDRRSNGRQVRTDPWTRLGRLLPQSLRTRVFEPAYFDLLAERQRRALEGGRFALLVLGLALESYRVGGPGLILQFARSRKAATWVAVAIVGSASLLVVLRIVYEASGAYATQP